MKHYFIDGYNLLFRVQGKPRPLQHKRQELISLINQEAILFSLNITLVFDGAQIDADDLVRGHFDAIEIVYTRKNQTADEYILEELHHIKNRAIEVVITSDNQLASHCKSLGAKTESIEQFLSFLANKHKKAQKKHSEQSVQKAFQDSKSNIERLLKIFEARLD